MFDFRKESIQVFVGVHNPYHDLESWNMYEARKVVVHPRHKSKCLRANIALIRLTHPLKFNEDVRPICLPTRGNN